MTTVPTAHRPRHADGRFAAYAAGEASLDLLAGGSAETTDLLGSLPTWTPPAGTDTPTGSFDRCKKTSADYTAFLREHGVDAEWVQVVGPTTDLPDALPGWKALPQEHWQHYLTLVTAPDGSAYYVDWTARQFDPAAGHPHVVEVDGADWAEDYYIRDSALHQYRAMTRHR